jgi:hypothetical protein
LVGQNTFLLKNCFVDITPWTIKAKDIFKGKNILIFLCYDYYISYKLQIFSGRKTDFKFRRFRVRTPLMFLIIKIYYKYSSIIKIFPTLEYQLRLMTWEWIGTHSKPHWQRPRLDLSRSDLSTLTSNHIYMKQVKFVFPSSLDLTQLLRTCSNCC